MNKNYSLIAIALCLSPIDAHAYLDPGTGSLIAQAVIGAVAGAFMFMKLYWGKIKSFFSKNKSEDSE